MDKSLHQQMYNLPRASLGGGGGGSNFGGSRGRLSLSAATNMAGAQKTGLNSSISSLKKTALNNSRFSLSARSNQSILGIRSDYSVVESYGSPMPVAINEALMLKDLSHSVSANICENGWAWVVQNRCLLVWQYKDTSKQDTASPKKRRCGVLLQCRELTLPHSDIGHKASLISVFQPAGQQTASCIAVSATGDVRFWNSIAHDSSSMDIVNILDGQEFYQLLDLPHQNGYLLATTTCSLIFLQVQLKNGRYELTHRAVKQPTGFLGGFGKKFASIIIGMNNSLDKEQCFVSMACESNTKRESIVSVLSDRSLQRWSLSNNGQTEQLIYEDSEILRKIRDEFKQKIWNIRLPTDHVEIDLHLLDMRMHRNKIYLLCGAVNKSHTPQMYYSIVVLSPLEDCIHLENFTPLKLTKFFGGGTEQDCLSLRFIVSRSHLYLYNAKVVYPVLISNISPTTELEAEKVEFHLHDDCVLSAAVCANIPLFFSRTHGLVSITPGDFDSNDFVNMSISSPADMFASGFSNDGNANETLQPANSEANLHMFELDPDDLYNEFKDEVSQLKAAFIYRLKRKNNMVNTVITNLLQSIAEKTSGIVLEANSNVPELDKIVITIAEDLAEDIPFSDPRWEEAWAEQSNHKYALGSSRSMQIVTQLKNKSIALRQFIEFLHATNLWEKLKAVPSNGGSLLKPTCYVLSDLSEKIVAAITLRLLQNNKSKYIEDAISNAVAQWTDTNYKNLTAQDIFYVKLCKFQDIFQSFVDVVDECISSYQQQTYTSVAAVIYDINGIILEVIRQVFQFREKNTSTFILPSNKLDSYEYLPWTAMSGSAGVRDTLSRLIDISVRNGAHCANEPDLKQKLYQQILEMMDIILDGRKNYLESVRDTEKYNVLQQQFESQRRELISVLIDNKQYEIAAKLAEKYLDLQSLVLICDLTDNQERLNDYIKKFEEFNFSQIAINWHLRQNRRGEVFERFKDNQAALAQFMRDHPTLGWIQLIFNGDFERSAKVLFQLAQCETEFVQRKKSMLALAKLAAFAATDSDMTEQLENINTELSIIEYQESLGENILEAFGYDLDAQKVLKVEEIINLLIAEENDTANEFDFRKALELLNFMEEPYDARHKIWCAAILRDNWTDYDADNAVDYIQNLLFFKLIEVCHLMDAECDSFLPPIDDFMHSSELSDLTNIKSFQYLLKLTYEYVYDSFKKSEEMDIEM